MKNNERITMRERTLRHRSVHPRDRISFGEMPIPENDELSKSSLREGAISPTLEQIMMPDHSRRRLSKPNRIRACRCGKSNGMGKCQTVNLYDEYCN